ncbi:hypothetical protein GCM10010255_00880 [Streptomyces coeruleofuscus]|uniref:MmyB-like transcription regulator ligand binding domain-containing protein n=2 Tax=Streptomyces coeruleofuscus TaxID=66879 RepID=A0ABN3HGR7_9ACTN
MDDPALANVWNGYPGEQHEVVRQHLFANLTFGHFLLFYEWGDVTEEELLEYARTLLRSPLFHRYWEASRGGKEGLSPDSHEGRPSESSSRPSANLRRTEHAIHRDVAAGTQTAPLTCGAGPT